MLCNRSVLSHQATVVTAGESFWERLHCDVRIHPVLTQRDVLVVMVTAAHLTVRPRLYLAAPQRHYSPHFKSKPRS